LSTGVAATDATDAVIAGAVVDVSVEVMEIRVVVLWGVAVVNVSAEVFSPFASNPTSSLAVSEVRVVVLGRGATVDVSVAFLEVTWEGGEVLLLMSAWSLEVRVVEVGRGAVVDVDVELMDVRAVGVVGVGVALVEVRVVEEGRGAVVDVSVEVMEVRVVGVGRVEVVEVRVVGVETNATAFT